MDSQNGQRIPGNIGKIQERTGKVGQAWREIEGHACPYCGCLRYTLVFRVAANGYAQALAARCTQCYRQREIQLDAIEEDMKKLNGSPGPQA